MDKEYTFKCVIEKVDHTYCSLCLDLDIASEGSTPEESLKNLIEAIELYLITALEQGEEKEFIPRRVPDYVFKKYQNDIREVTLNNKDFGQAASLAYV